MMMFFRSSDAAVAVPRHRGRDHHFGSYHRSLRVVSQEAEGERREIDARKRVCTVYL